MKRHWIFAFVFCLMAIACERENVKPDTPVSNTENEALFSVTDGHQVTFSKGNLQYCITNTHNTADGIMPGTFRFAEHQYDYLGEANANISDTNSGWIDLFCWGSSGWHVEPNSLKDGDYDIESLCGGEAYADWGVYNSIGGDPMGTWRTLTHEEWDYLINRRAASSVDGTDSARYAEATVAGTNGLVIFPDNFVKPESIAPIQNINHNNFAIAFTDNVYTAEQWTLLEQAGAVFLPAAGFRGGTWLSTIGEGGSYWASTCNADRQAYALLFIDGLVNSKAECTYEKDRGYGRSVRLAKDIKKQH